MSVKMHGPALDGSGEIHETSVHEDNVTAFKLSGWVEGGIPKPAKAAASAQDPAGTASDSDDTETDAEVDHDSLMRLTKAQLVVEAEGKGIEVSPDDMTKEQIVAAILG